MVCNNTETAEELVNTSEITTFQHPRDQKRYAPRQIGNDENKKYITLIDGTTDARFYITGCSWENIIAMENFIGKGDIPQSTSMSLDGELEIMEPLGASFLNRLTTVCDDLSSDPVGLVFVLKTIFVGHRDDGTTEMISNIKPLLFINYDITAVFDSSGAKYKMSFVGVVNGVGKLPHTQKIFNGLKFNVKTGENLSKTFENIAIKVNAAYVDFKKQAILEFSKTLYEAATKAGESLSAQAATAAATKFFDANYREVLYEIIAPDYNNEKYVAGDNESVRIKTKQEVGSFNYGNDIGVEELIKKVMASSTGVLDDAAGIGNPDGARYIYKIVSGLRSTHDAFIVQYHVKRYEMIMLPYETASKGQDIVPIPGQSIEFNYIFTGKNVDIKSFDIKMEMGMAFFQIAATTDTLPDQNATIDGLNSSVVKGTGSISVASNNKKRRTQTPLFLGSQIKEAIARNTRNPVKSASFQSLLSRHAALENIVAKMVIYGNPQLLGEMQILPSDIPDDETETPKENKTINPKWLSTPTLIKVNIKMPVDSNDSNTEYDNFWYTGYYSIFAVKQIFQDGEFIQELELMSIPVSDELQKTPDKPTKTAKVQKEDLAAFLVAARKELGIDALQSNTNGTDGDSSTVKAKAQVRRQHRGRTGSLLNSRNR